MNQTEQVSPLGESDLLTTQQSVERARRDGITRFQVVALVHPGEARDYVLLLDHRPDRRSGGEGDAKGDTKGDEVWTLPVAEVRPTETVALTLDWLCNRHLGLRSWSATFSRAATYEAPGGEEVLQLAFDVPVPEGNRMTWKGPCQWWHIGTEPASLHRLSRPVFEQAQQAERTQRTERARELESVEESTA